MGMGKFFSPYPGLRMVSDMGLANQGQGRGIHSLVNPISIDIRSYATKQETCSTHVLAHQLLINLSQIINILIKNMGTHT